MGVPSIRLVSRLSSRRTRRTLWRGAVLLVPPSGVSSPAADGGGSLLVAIVQSIGTLLKWIELKAREDGNLPFLLIACCFRCVFVYIEALLEM